MAFTALLGALAGIALIIVSIFLSTDNYQAFFSLASFLMVFGGTTAATFMSFQPRYVVTAFKAIWWMVQKPKSTREGLNTEIMRLVKWAYLVQKKGLPALENEIKSVQSSDPVIRYCLEVVTTGHKPEELRPMMETIAESEFDRKTVTVDVLKKMAATAPAFGMIGTLVGLVAVLQGMGAAGDDLLNSVGKGMSLALMTTLYGVIFAQLIFAPAASQLQQKEEIERFRNYMVVEGLVMLAEKRSPRFMQDRLNSYLDPDIHFNIDTQLS